MLIIHDHPRQYYIDNWPNCGHKCKPGQEFKCCRNCAEANGFYEPQEILENIEDYRQKDGGFLTEGHAAIKDSAGCALPLNLRSYKCLSWDCKYGKPSTI